MVESRRDKFGKRFVSGILLASALLSWVAIVVLAANQEPARSQMEGYDVIADIILAGRQ